jgi:hypothetical protein
MGAAAAGNDMTATKIAAPTAAVAAVLVAIFGPKIGTVSTSSIATYLALFLGGIAGAVHAPAVKKTVVKTLPKRKPRPIKHPGPVAMYDAVDVSQIPANAEAVAGYVGGSWPTFAELASRFRHAHRFSIAVNAGEDAACLDIENGDATPDQAPAWAKRQLARGQHRPCLYASASQMPAVWAAIARAGIHRQEVRLWVADWTYQPHIPAGYDACQWTDKALGRNLDESLCTAGFFG